MISTRGRYALRVMVDLAEHEKGQYIPLKDIAAYFNPHTTRALQQHKKLGTWHIVQ